MQTVSLIAFLLSGLLLGACGETRRALGLGAEEERAETPAGNQADEAGDEEAEDEEAAAKDIVWPRAVIKNERDFNNGIPEGDLEIEFAVEGASLDDFEITCRAAPLDELEKAEAKECEDSFEIDSYEKYRPYRFDLMAVHKKTKKEQILTSASFTTDPLAILLPEEPALKRQFSGIMYLHFELTRARPVYYTCSNVSDLDWDPTFECRDGLLILDFTRFVGVHRLRIMAWDLETNERLAERSTFFCSGFLCPRNLSPVSPPPF